MWCNYNISVYKFIVLFYLFKCISLIVHHKFLIFDVKIVSILSLTSFFNMRGKVNFMALKLLRKMDLFKIVLWIFWLTIVLFTLVTGSADPTCPPPGAM